MGQFAGTLFSMLLGWVQTAVSWLWGLITNADAGAWGAWLLEHWLPLTVLLCIGGVAADFLVYLLRWQPYRVWGSFLHRFGRREEPSGETAEQPVFQRKWVYADGSTQVEDIRQQDLVQPPQEEDRLNAPIRPTRRVARRATLEQSYHAPVYPPQWQNDQHTQGDNE